MQSIVVSKLDTNIYHYNFNLVVEFVKEYIDTNFNWKNIFCVNGVCFKN